MDNLGAIGGPLVAIALVGLIGVRSAILLSVIPGLLAAVAIVYAIRHTAKPTVREHQSIRLRVRPLLRGRLGGLLAAAAAFEIGNLAATLLILRATDLLESGRSHTSAVQLALVLYAGYNLAATLSSIPAGHVGDRRGMVRILAAGAACFLLAYVGLAASGWVLRAAWHLLRARGYWHRLWRDGRERGRRALCPRSAAGLGLRAPGDHSGDRQSRCQRDRGRALDSRLASRRVYLHCRLDGTGADRTRDRRASTTLGQHGGRLA